MMDVIISATIQKRALLNYNLILFIETVYEIFTQSRACIHISSS